MPIANISRVKNLGWAFVAGVLTAASPSPSPSLDTVLLTPPSGFVEVTTALLHGHFTATDYASTADASKRADIVATMQRDGFVDGYSDTWASQASQHVLFSAVLAFTGGHGAHNWLTAAEAADKTDPKYVRGDTTTGLGTYYGVHLADAAAKTYGDAFSFVKGNDVFLVLVVSRRDDALSQATSLASTQFSSAPDETIPTDQWPENANPPASASAWTAGFLVFLTLAVLISAVALIVRRRRRGAVPPLAYAPVPFAVQLSPDGNYWWDGQAWRDASREAPPYAQRSSDGALWWDGRTWRPVPMAPPFQ